MGRLLARRWNLNILLLRYDFFSESHFASRYSFFVDAENFTQQLNALSCHSFLPRSSTAPFRGGRAYVSSVLLQDGKGFCRARRFRVNRDEHAASAQLGIEVDIRPLFPLSHRVYS